MPNYKKYSALEVGDVVRLNDGEVEGIVTEIVRENGIISRILIGDRRNYIAKTFSNSEFEVLSSKSCQCKKEEWKEGDRIFLAVLDSGNFTVINEVFDDSYKSYFDRFIKANLAYHTKEEAESALERIKGLLLEIKNETP